MAKSSSSPQKFHFVSKHRNDETREKALEKIDWGTSVTADSSQQSNSDQDKLSVSHLDFINLFNPPKSNPNGRLASSKLFDTKGSQKLALSSQQFWENKRGYFNSWRVSTVSIILLVNVLSAIVILKDRLSSPVVNQELEITLEILAGKTNLAAQEFITPDLNSLSRISLAAKNNNIVKSKTKSTVSLPLAIPPTNLPNQGIISPRAANTSYYYILADYTGEKSLQLAQKQVKNVSLVNFPQGVFIYLGAFSEKTLAQTFVNQVKGEGLDAYIYPTQ